jgi:hypothetical protein
MLSFIRARSRRQSFSSRRSCRAPSVYPVFASQGKNFKGMTKIGVFLERITQGGIDLNVVIGKMYMLSV